MTITMPDQSAPEAVVPREYVDRAVAAVYAAGVAREAIEFEWPECHKDKCQARHGSPDAAFGHMKAALSRALRAELESRATTRPDVAEEDDSSQEVAIYTLAALLHRYRPELTSTYVQAARLIVDAYPGMVSALAGTP